MSMLSKFDAAADDVASSFSRSWFWMALGWSDVRHRFSGSVLGSLWITANIALVAGALTLVFAHPLGLHSNRYAPFVVIGLVLWQFIQTTLNEAANVFVAAGETIRHSPMPLCVHVLRLLWRNLIALGHNAVVVIATMLIFRVGPTALWTLVPALLLLAITVFWASLFIGLLGARFRDVGQIVTNLLQLLFFLTPIFWPPEAIGAGRNWIVAFNPFFAVIDIVRAPLLGVPAAPLSWPVAAFSAAFAATGTFIAFAKLRSRVAYWV